MTHFQTARHEYRVVGMVFHASKPKISVYLIAEREIGFTNVNYFLIEKEGELNEIDFQTPRF